MKTHVLTLASEPFEAIKNGNKTIESRLYDEKRKLVELGDEIVFINREAQDQSIRAEVVGLLRYSSFKELFSHNEPTKFNGSSVDWLLNQIHEFYSDEDEEKYSVVGIEFIVMH